MEARVGEDREGGISHQMPGRTKPVGHTCEERRGDLKKAMGKIRTEKERERGGKRD